MEHKVVSLKSPSRMALGLVTAGLLFSGLTIGAETPTAPCDRSPLLVRDVSVWSPEGIQARRDVLVSQGRVQSVLPSRRAPKDVPKGARIIDGRGQTLLPGFIDSHLHLSFNGWRGDRPGDHRWGAAAFTGPQSLSSGVTNARLHLMDLRTGAMFRRESQDDCAPLPRLQSAGPAFIPGAPTHYDSGVWAPTSADDAADRVRRARAAGFDWIAVHQMHQFSPEIREAIVSTTRDNGMRLLGSGYSQDDVESSLAARPDTIDYIDTSPLPEYAPRLIETARAQPQLVWVARLGIHFRRELYRQKPERVSEPIHYRFFPEAEVQPLIDFAAKELATTDSDYAKRMASSWPTMQRKFQQLRESGIPLAAGTDAGSPLNAHADAIWWELRSWVEFGATPTEALKAVTVNGARVLNRDDLGVIRAGAMGDFVLYRGDVSRGDFDVAKVTHVAKGGVLYVEKGQWKGASPP